jgi:hypothetical protein
VLPAAANYAADKPLYEYAKGTITGDMAYSVGDSHYSPKMFSTGSYVNTTTIAATIPAGTSVAKARLYVYWTWSYYVSNSTGVLPVMNVTINGGSPLTLDAHYNDSKDYGTYNYPSGTYCYDVTDDVINGNNVINITNAFGAVINTSFNIQAVGLLTLTNDPSLDVPKYYWIGEGCDLLENTYNKTNDTWMYETPDATKTTPDNCVAFANFTDVTKNSGDTATLITAVPAAGTVYNRLYVNNFFNYWDGLWNGCPVYDGNFSCATTDVTNNIVNGTNYIGFQDGLYSMIGTANSAQEGQMQAANAFLLVEP